jgi:hypothetical protein
MLNDAFLTLDKGMVMPLVLLDLTAAFDVVDHELLLRKCHTLGITDSAHKWIQDYLCNRSQIVSCSGVESQSSILSCGVPQGSILGPLLFSIFISDISTVFKKHPVKYVLYADDLQIFTPSSIGDLSATLSGLEACLSDVHRWLSSQLLVLNPKKCELIIFSSTRNATTGILDSSLLLDDCRLKASSAVRNLGILLDSNLNLNSHINNVRKQAFMYLRVISKVRRLISKKHSALLVDSLALSRINFCVSLFTGLPKKQLDRLQSVINYGIRIVEKLKRKCHPSSSQTCVAMY